MIGKEVNDVSICRNKGSGAVRMKKNKAFWSKVLENTVHTAQILPVAGVVDVE